MAVTEAEITATGKKVETAARALDNAKVDSVVALTACELEINLK